MKVRKDTIKKPKFLVCYLKSLITVFLIFAVLGAFVGTLMYMEYVNEAAQELSVYDLNDAVNQYIYDKNDKQKEKLSNDDRNRIKGSLIGLYLSTGQRSRVYIRDAGMIDSSQAVLLYHTDYGDQPDNGEFDPEKARSFVLNLADEKYMQYFTTPEIKEMWVIDGSHNSDCFEGHPELQFICKKYYVNFDKGLFIPVEVEICTANEFTNFKPTGKIINIDPGNTDGFTLVVSEPGKNANLGNIAGYDGVERDEDYEHYSTSDYSLIYKTEYTEPQLVPFTTRYKTLFTNGIIAIIWAALAFAFIPATVSYNNKKRRYEIYEYRLKMIDAMAHDLKTPMAAISAYAENLSSHIGSDKQEYYAGKVEEKVSQMNKMVSDILEFSKSEKQPAAINKESIDISDVILTILSDNEHIITERSLKIDYDKKSVTFKTDENLFRQALSNLINNAVLYSKTGSVIEIACGEKSLTISNEPDEEIEPGKDLKQPFVKGNTARGNKGTGLGLAIAKNNLAMLGFKLEIKCDNGKFTALVKMS